MIGAIAIGIAGMLVVLGVISLQIATLGKSGWFMSALTMVAFLISLATAFMLFIVGLTGAL